MQGQKIRTAVTYPNAISHLIPIVSCGFILGGGILSLRGSQLGGSSIPEEPGTVLETNDFFLGVPQPKHLKIYVNFSRGIQLQNKGKIIPKVDIFQICHSKKYSSYLIYNFILEVKENFQVNKNCKMLHFPQLLFKFFSWCRVK